MTKIDEKISDRIFKTLSGCNTISLEGAENKLTIFMGEKSEMMGGLRLPTKQLVIQSNKKTMSMAIHSENFDLNKKILEKNHSFKELKAIIAHEIEMA